MNSHNLRIIPPSPQYNSAQIYYSQYTPTYSPQHHQMTPILSLSQQLPNNIEFRRDNSQRSSSHNRSLSQSANLRDQSLQINTNQENQYLKHLEQKIILVLAENDKLINVVKGKNYELEGFKDLESKVKLLLDENNQLNELLNEKENENHNEDLQEILIEKEKEISELKEKCEHLEKTNRETGENLENLLFEHEKLKSFYSKSQNSYENLHNKFSNLLNDNTKLNEILLKNMNSVHESDHFKLDVQRLLQENENLNSMINKMSQNIGKLSINSLEKTSENKEIDEENEDYKEKKILHSKCLLMLEENEKLVKLAEEKEKESEYLRSELNSLSVQLAQEIQQSEKEDKKNKDLSDRVKLFRRDFEEYKNFTVIEKKRLEQEFNLERFDFNVEKKNLLEKLNEYEREFTRVIGEKENLENIINEKEKINNELRFINEITRNEAFAFLKEKDEIKNQLLNTQDELAKNEIEVQNHKSQLLQWKTMIENGYIIKNYFYICSLF